MRKREHMSLAYTGSAGTISVIVACYNVERYLSRCLDSIRSQTYTDLEVWLIDDGARDGTGHICDLYADEDTRFHVVHQDNGGLSCARNEGLARATGDLIAFVDGDDYLEPRMLEYLAGAITATDSDVAICPYICEPDDTTAPADSTSRAIDPRIQRDEPPRGIHLRVGGGALPDDPAAHAIAAPHYRYPEPYGDMYELEPPELLTVYIEERDEMPIQNAAWNKLYRRKLIGQLRFPDQRFYEDIVIQTRLLAAASRAVFVDIPLYHYIINRRDSIMGTPLREEILTEQLPSYREKDAFLTGIGRQDLTDTHDYLVYKKLLLLYTQARRGTPDRSVSVYKEPLMRELSQLPGDYARIAASPIADPHQLLRMRLYMRRPWLYDRFMDINDTLILPLRARLSGHKKEA